MHAPMRTQNLGNLLWLAIAWNYNRSVIIVTQEIHDYYSSSRLLPLFPLLNPHSEYVKIDAYLLQFLGHMTSDVKFSHMLFFLIYISVQKLYSTK